MQKRYFLQGTRPIGLKGQMNSSIYRSAMLLKNKVAVVTGSGQGIGKGISLALAEEGADVVTPDIDLDKSKETAEEIENMGRKSLSIKTDISRKEDVEDMVNETLSEFDEIDILVNNAGIVRTAPSEEISEKDWRDILDVNLTGTFQCSQLVGDVMIEQKKGNIVNIASIDATVPSPCRGSYSATKAAIVNLTRQLAMEWGKYNIRVNSISPGLIKTPLSEQHYNNENIREEREKILPLGRIGMPKDIGNAVVLVVSDKASYITGENIVVDGGLLSSFSNSIPRRDKNRGSMELVDRE